MMEQVLKNIEDIPRMGQTAEELNPTAYLKFYSTIGRGEWYAIEMDFTGTDLLMFGYVKSPLGADCDEFGTFTLNQLTEVNKEFGFGVIELDTSFEPCKIKEVI